jgi:hypothetical protein
VEDIGMLIRKGAVVWGEEKRCERVDILDIFVKDSPELISIECLLDSLLQEVQKAKHTF